MELQGTHQFMAPLDAVWDALMDPAVLSKAMPGGDQLERVGENDYRAAMSVRVGPVQGRFDGKVTLTDVVPHQSYHMKVSGTGAPGFLNGEGDLSLAENEAGTLLTYTGDVQIGGRIASVGQRLVDSTAKSIIRQGLKSLDEQLVKASEVPVPLSVENEAAPAPVVTESPPSAPTPTPTPAYSYIQSEPASTDFGKMAVNVAKDIVQDLASDYVPREKQPQAFAFILGALAMLLFVMLVRAVQRD